MNSTEHYLNNASTPPYVPYRTFRTFLEFVYEQIPDRIDRSVLKERFSGSSASQLMSTLRVLNLIGTDGKTTPELELLANSVGKERRERLGKILRTYYRPLFELNLSRVTRAQFSEAFKNFGVPDKLRQKCEAFFIQAALDADVKLSGFILKGRHNAKPTEKVLPATTALKPTETHNQATPPRDYHIAELILNKYPDFDASWEPEVQKRWLEGMKDLHDSLRGAA